jgi:hypothetical protein
MPATATTRSIAFPRQLDTAAVAGMARSYGRFWPTVRTAKLV